MRVKPFGIDLYFPPKFERAYFIKPHLGKSDKQKAKNFTEIEAGLHKYVPGPIYAVRNNWTKDFPFGKGRFLKGSREIP
jgi:hypothetical protein